MSNDMSSLASAIDGNEWLNVDAVATVLDLKPVTVKRYAREGLLNGKQINNEWQFLSSDIEKFKDIQSKL